MMSVYSQFSRLAWVTAESYENEIENLTISTRHIPLDAMAP